MPNTSKDPAERAAWGAGRKAAWQGGAQDYRWQKRIFCGVVFVGKGRKGLQKCHEGQNQHWSLWWRKPLEESRLPFPPTFPLLPPPPDTTGSSEREDWMRKVQEWWRGRPRLWGFEPVRGSGKRSQKNCKSLERLKVGIRTRLFLIPKDDTFIMTWNAPEKLWDPSTENDEKAYIWEKKYTKVSFSSSYSTVYNLFS